MVRQVTQILGNCTYIQPAGTVRVDRCLQGIWWRRYHASGLPRVLEERMSPQPRPHGNPLQDFIHQRGQEDTLDCLANSK